MSVDARIRELMLENLFAVFSERDPKRRLDVIARNYTEDVSWTDPDALDRSELTTAIQLVDQAPNDAIR